ncbi:phage baseplate protein [Hydrogenophaga pseudoflava]|uniref:phage baseplate protein n=1 Tax=Hydrogenophaga pseudoflava TaxID=47421 RepID=UPI0027E3BC74|nr:hypothetical protein [Hydrogenophaga pseudoflava]MDQ7745451.1 hypothetical protein [Hydrogenophaga pseudoflava]
MPRVTVFRAIGEMEFDATFMEDHTSDLEVTDNPIETGALVSDHAFMRPLRVEITAGVSDILTPSGNPAYGGGSGRAQTAYQLLTELQKSAEPFIVQTGLKVYENMVCESIRTAQDATSAHILYFVASLREVLIVETESTTYPPRAAGATTQQASKQVNRGETQGKQVGSSEGQNPNNGTQSGQGADASIAKRIFGAVK